MQYLIYTLTSYYTSTGMSGPPDSYFYTDTQGLQWDRTHGYWTRDDLSSDLSVDRLHSGRYCVCTQTQIGSTQSFVV